MKIPITGSLLALLLFTVSLPATAANHYVRAGASGDNNGSNWTNAYTTLPLTLSRGDTYFIAEGNYGSYTFDDDASGSTTIIIKKCTAADHGTETGFSLSYCDGQAVFDDLTFTRPYYFINGAVRNEFNWKDAAAYGMRVAGGVTASIFWGGHLGNGCSADNLSFMYLHVGNTGTTFSTYNGSRPFFLGGFGEGTEACENWTISRVLIQNTGEIQCAGCSNMIFEYSHFYKGWSKEAIRGQVFAENNIIRWNVFEDSCQRNPDDSTSGCTAEIAMWDGSGFSGNQVYGNILKKTTDTEVNANGVILFGGDTYYGAGVPVSNTKVFNNTIVGLKNMAGGRIGIDYKTGTGNEVRNNLWYDNIAHGCQANICSNNLVALSNPFVSYPLNLHLNGPTAAGYVLPSPYAQDMDNTPRGTDGTWDIGAYEYTTGNPALLSPRGLRVQ